MSALRRGSCSTTRSVVVSIYLANGLTIELVRWPYKVVGELKSTCIGRRVLKVDDNQLFVFICRQKQR